MAPSIKNPPTPGSHQLFRGVLSETDAPLPLSAAGQQATRLAACRDGSFIFATGPQVYKLNCSPTRKRTRSEQDSKPRFENSSLASGNGVASAVSSAIADDYIVPRPFSSFSLSRYVIHSSHLSEVQSVTADETRVASVDAYGRGVITVETKPLVTDGPSGNSEADTSSFILTPASFSNGDKGWAGITLRRNDPKTAAVTRQFFRDLTIFDLDVPVRTIYTPLPPSAAAFCGDGSTVTVAEGPDITFYDCRAGESRGSASRKTVGSGSLLSIDVAEDGYLIAAAGMDRVLNVFDVRMMTVRDRWPACLKYECAGTVLSREMDGMAYVCSVDNEVACGAWSAGMAEYLRGLETSQSLMISGANTKSPRRAFGFRADVRLTGIARRVSNGEEVAVMSESGAFYMLRRKAD